MVLRDISHLAVLSAIEPAPPANDASTNPCLACGACCGHFRVSFYCGELAGENGGWVPLEYVSQLSPLRACMKGTEIGGNRCTALQGEIGQPGIRCEIYASRPSPCREFETWLPDGTPNPDCQRLRLAIGLALLEPRIDEDENPREPPNSPGHPHAA